ncbi:endonuclease domain-containing protein [Vibrio sp.]|uniref:endonuclease domain-containing protein n=1 Tax=Vibrio sp. TaxID=678 RepID=UPI003D12F94A
MKIRTKTCSRCGQKLPVTQFYIDRSKKDGRRNSCIKCDKRYYEQNKRRLSQRKFINTHGVGLIYKNFLLASQGFKCAICGKSLKPNSSSACLDHDHIYDDIRGVLCRTCNAYIGRFGDNIIDVSKGIMSDVDNKLLANAYGYLLNAL